MAMTYQKFASLGVNLNRQAYGPLDISNVFTSAADLKYYLTKGTFTEGVSEYWYKSATEKIVPYPYEGQVLATVIDGVVSVYALSLDAEGNFQTQEIGAKVEVDGKTIKLNAEGKLELVGLPADITGKTLVPSLVNGELTWAEPDTSTAEGQAQEIEGLKARATALETTVNGKPESSEGAGDAVVGLVAKVAALEAVDNATQAELDAYKGEVTAAIAEALQNAKDYADQNDADTVYDDTQVKADIGANKTAIEGLQTSIGNVYTKTEVDGKFQEVNNTIASITHFTTQVVASVDDVTAVGVLYLIKDDSVTGVDKYNEYLYIEGQGAVLIGDTTTDLSNYVTTDALNAAIADFVTSEGLASAIEGKADKTAVNEALALKANTADVVANSTFETFKTENNEAIAAARTGAVSDVEAKGYAVAADVNAELAKKIETGSIAHSSESLTEGVTVDGTKLNIVVDAYTKQEVRDYVAEATGGQSAAEVLTALNNYKSDNDTRVGAIETKNTEQDTAIAAAKTQADKGVADAAKVAGDLATANLTIAENTRQIGVVDGKIDTVNNTLSEKITALEGKDTTIESNITALQTLTSGHTTTITEQGTKITALENKDTELAALIQGNTDKFADYSTTTQMNKAIDDKIAAIPAVDLSDYAKSADIEATYAKIGDAYTKAEADAEFMTESEVDSRINALIVAADPEGGKVITNIQNLVQYVDENAGEIAALVTATNANTAKLAGIDTTVVAYVNNALAAIVQPKGSAEVTVAEDGTLGLGQVSTDKLVMGTDTLVINGGSAV